LSQLDSRTFRVLSTLCQIFDHYLSWTLVRECYSYLLFPTLNPRSFHTYVQWIREEYIAPLTSATLPPLLLDPSPPSAPLLWLNQHSLDDHVPFSLVSCLNRFPEASPSLSFGGAVDEMISMLLTTGLQNSELSLECLCLRRFALLRVALNTLRSLRPISPRVTPKQIRDGC
jgi:hypothetical protein